MLLLQLCFYLNFWRTYIDNLPCANWSDSYSGFMLVLWFSISYSNINFISKKCTCPLSPYKNTYKALVCAKLKAVQPSNFFLRTWSFGRQYLFTLLPVTPKLKEQTLAIRSLLNPILNRVQKWKETNSNKACKKLYGFQSIHL